MQLRGLRVVITRNREQNAALRERLRDLGADVVCFPTIRFDRVALAERHRDLLREPERYSHLVFASRNAVRFFAQTCDELGAGHAAWAERSVAAVGQATAAACQELGWHPALIARGGGAALAAELLGRGGIGETSRVLLPGPRIARPELPDALERAGVAVTSIAVYETVNEEPECAREFLDAVDSDHPPDAILFASPSAIRAFLALGGDAAAQFLAGCRRVVSIGGTTSGALREHGVEPDAEAAVPGEHELVAALEGLS